MGNVVKTVKFQNSGSQPLACYLILYILYEKPLPITNLFMYIVI